MRRCLTNMESRTPTSAKARIHTSNSRTPVLASARPRRKRRRPNRYKISSPSDIMCRCWKCSPPLIAIVAGWTSYSTGSSVIITIAPRNKRSTLALSESAAQSVSAKWQRSLTRSASRHWSIPSIGTFRSTTSLPPTIACFNLWTAWKLPNLMRRSADRLHTSSDGQKFEVRADSLNANYSYKYFGKGQGVSAYTFRDERDLLWYSLVFSSADRESAYVIDGDRKSVV